MGRSRQFYWRSILDTGLFLAVLVAINLLWFRYDPAFRSQPLHPYLIPIIMVGLFYGFREGLAALLLTNIVYSTQLVLGGANWTSLQAQPDLRNILIFVVAGVCFGEAGELYRRALDHHQRRENELETSLQQIQAEKEQLATANTELEEWIRFGDVQLTEIHAVANELFSFDEARILDVIAPLNLKIIGAEQCSLYLLDQTNHRFIRHSQAGRNGVSNPASIDQNVAPFNEIKTQPRILSIKDVPAGEGVRYLIAVPVLFQSALRGVLLVESMPLVRLTAYTLANLGFVSDLINRCLDTTATVQTGGAARETQTVFRERIQQEVRLSNRANMDLSLLYVDVENFTEVQEQLGAETTGSLVNQILRVVEKNKRRSDVLSYQGNGRFAVLMPQTSEEKTNAFIDRTRDEISNLKIPSDQEGELAISFTLGTNMLTESGFRSPSHGWLRDN